MSTVRSFVSLLSEDQKLQIVKDWENFRIEGQIGDCVLRSKALELKHSLMDVPITLVMWEIYTAVCEFYTFKQFGISFE